MLDIAIIIIGETQRPKFVFCPGLTFEEGRQVEEGAVVGVPVPLLEGQAVEGLQAEGLLLAIHHHHLGRVPVQAGDVLGEARRLAGGTSDRLCSIHLTIHPSD